MARKQPDEASPHSSANPPEPKRRRHGKHTIGQKAVLVVNSVVVLACFAAAGGLVYAKESRENFLAVPKVDIDTDPTAAPPLSVDGVDTTVPGTEPSGPQETFPAADPTAQNFLIAGEANNACVDPGSPWFNAGADNRSYAELSDTIMVMRVDPATKQAAVLSFQRDLWVDIAGKNSKQRINTAYKKNDYSRLAQTIYDNFGVTVDHYLQIDFCAFKTIIDAIGGVSVPFDRPIRDPNVGLQIDEVGCHTFSGDEALAYVRTRKLEYYDEASGEWKNDGTSDFGRVSRQQDFIRRVLQAALNKGLFNADLARGVLESMQKYVVTEQGFSINKMMEFAGALKDVDPQSVATYQVESRGMKVGGASVLQPLLDGDNMKAILAIFKGEAPLAGAPEQVFETTTTPPGGGEGGDATQGDTQGDTQGNTIETTAPADTQAPTATTAAPATGPVENPKGEVPSRDKTCP
jgi:LCP family protein required for cell wall assembly